MNTQAVQAPRQDGTDLQSLLDLDQGLASLLPPDELETVRRNVFASVVQLEQGPWDGGEFDASDDFGLLVVDGLLTRDVTVAGIRSRELLGTGDLLRPWDVDDDMHPLSPQVGWSVLEPTRLARLDRRVLAVGARWPELVEELVHRTLYRSRWLAVRLAITSITRVDDRLMLFFWHAAARWGRVTPAGTVISFDLTHEVLGELVGARRPSVTTALSELREQGRLERNDGEWLLTGPPPDAESIAQDR